MKAKFFLVFMLAFAALEGHASSVLPSDGMVWPGKGSGIGKIKNSDVIALGADTSGASMADKISTPACNLAIVRGLNYGQAKKLQDSIGPKVRWGDVKGKGKKLGHSFPDESTPTPGVGAVPLPAAIWLFASALIGLTVVARRNMRTTFA